MVDHDSKARLFPGDEIPSQEAPSGDGLEARRYRRCAAGRGEIRRPAGSRGNTRFFSMEAQFWP